MSNHQQQADGDIQEEQLLNFLVDTLTGAFNLSLGENANTDAEAVYLDREFYDSKCLTLLYAHNYAFVMPIIEWGKRIQQETGNAL